MSPICRNIVEPVPASGAWNMAVDAALLESALERGTCVVRLYRWAEATLSLGHFQKPEEAVGDPRVSRLPRVRRLSGGGAILHHHEWTYSCVLPPNHPRAAVPHSLYRIVHEAILGVLAGRGVNAALRGGDASSGRVGGPSRAAVPEAFLCFARGDARDIVCRGHKVVGSAQRRRRGAVLQHGSILLERSEFAPEFPGIVDLVRNARIDADLGDELLERIADAIHGPTSDADPVPDAGRERVRPGELDEYERRRAGELVDAAAVRHEGRVRGAAKPQA